jgi:hypothetical protein
VSRSEDLDDDRPVLCPRFYVEMERDWARYMVLKGLAERTDRPCVVDVTSRVEGGKWASLGSGSYVLTDTTIRPPKAKGVRFQAGLGWWADGSISREHGVCTLWIEGLPYSVFKRFVPALGAA